jgi:hypothetical protein
MSVNEELSEQAEHAKEPFERNVAVTMAIIAAALAIVSVLGHLFANEELLCQQRASDQWAYYQAKSIRRYNSDIARDIFKNLGGEAAAKSTEKYEKNIEKYQKEGEEIQVEARNLEAESRTKGKQALRLHMGEIFLEVGIVFASLAILTKRRLVWGTSIVSACVGIGVALTTLMIHEAPVIPPPSEPPASTAHPKT